MKRQTDGTAMVGLRQQKALQYQHLTGQLARNSDAIEKWQSDVADQRENLAAAIAKAPALKLSLAKKRQLVLPLDPQEEAQRLLAEENGDNL